MNEMIERDITKEELAEVSNMLRLENEKLKAELEEARSA